MSFWKKDDTKKVPNEEVLEKKETSGLREDFVKDLEAQFGEINAKILPEFVEKMIEANVLCEKIEKLTENMSPEDQDLITKTWPDFVSSITSRYGLRTEHVPEAAGVVYRLAKKYDIVDGEKVEAEVTPESSNFDNSVSPDQNVNYDPNRVNEEAMERVIEEKKEVESEAANDILDSVRNNLDRIKD